MKSRPMKRRTILVADDDLLYLEDVKEQLEEEGYLVVAVGTPEEARKVLKAGGVDLAILDLHMRGDGDGEFMDRSGLELARDESFSIPRIILTMNTEATKRDLGDIRTVWKDEPLNKLLTSIKKALPPRVFVVHGHDDGAKEAVALWLEKQRLPTRILGDEAGAGRPILENLARAAEEADIALVLLTGDDQGDSLDDPKGLQPRARQNVIFELGYFIAHLGPEYVFVLRKSGVEVPSDYDGILFVDFDKGGAWKQRLREEFEHVGVNLSLYAPA